MKKVFAASLIGMVLCFGSVSIAEASVATAVKNGIVRIWNLLPQSLTVLNGVVHAIHTGLHKLSEELEVDVGE